MPEMATPAISRPGPPKQNPSSAQMVDVGKPSKVQARFVEPMLLQPVEEKTRKGNPCTPSFFDQPNQDIASGEKC